MKKRVLIIGMGSIGRRHARVFSELGAQVEAVSAYPQPEIKVYSTLPQAFEGGAPHLVLIANPTSQHFSTLNELAHIKYSGLVLVEKPLYQEPKALVGLDKSAIFVAYNLRFHPILERLKALLIGKQVISVQAYVGQYLPTWRPERPYQESYSAKKAEGGGAIRDLSHELDYLHWLFGPWAALSALGGKASDLEIDSDDHFCLLMGLASGAAVTLEVNYLDRRPARRISVNCVEGSFYADLIAGELYQDQNLESIKAERDQTYRGQNQALLLGQTENLCDYATGLAHMETIAAAERAAQKPYRWITQEGA